MQTRAICVTADPVLRRILRRSLHATGSQVEFVDTPDQVLALDTSPPDLILIDDSAHERAALERLLAGVRSRVIMMGLGVDHADALKLLRAEHCNNLIGKQSGEGADIDEDEVVVTAVKMITGDIFGIMKYLTWGVTIHEREVSGYNDKRLAIADVAEHARQVGCRRQLTARIETACDELLMNALYDAPAAARIADEPGQPARLEFACDGRFFGLSVRDPYGALAKASILDNLERARDEQGTPKAPDASESGGAGLGLYFILNSATRFVANISPGNATEVICLFDMRGNSRDFHYRAKSLNIFQGKVAGNG